MWCCWNTNPTRSRRNRVAAAASSADRSVSPTTIRPALGRSIAPSRWRRVDFPEPDGPTSDTQPPASSSASTARSASVSPYRRVARSIRMCSPVTVSLSRSSGGAQSIARGDAQGARHGPERGAEREGERRAERERRRDPADRHEGAEDARRDRLRRERARDAACEPAREAARGGLGEEERSHRPGRRAEGEAEADLLPPREEEDAERAGHGEGRRGAEGERHEQEQPPDLREERRLGARDLRQRPRLRPEDRRLDRPGDLLRRAAAQVGAHERERRLPGKVREVLNEREGEEEVLVLRPAGLDGGGDGHADGPARHGRDLDLLAGDEPEPPRERRAGHDLAARGPARRDAPERVQPLERLPRVADPASRHAVDPDAGEQRRRHRLDARARRAGEGAQVRLGEAPVLLDGAELERAEAEPERGGAGQHEEVRAVRGEVLSEPRLDAARDRDEAEDERGGERERRGPHRVRGEAPQERAPEPSPEEARPGGAPLRGHAASLSSGAGSRASARRIGQTAPAAATSRAPPIASGATAAPASIGVPNTASPSTRTSTRARPAASTPPTAPSASSSEPRSSETCHADAPVARRSAISVRRPRTRAAKVDATASAAAASDRPARIAMRMPSRERTRASASASDQTGRARLPGIASSTCRATLVTYGVQNHFSNSPRVMPAGSRRPKPSSGTVTAETSAREISPGRPRSCCAASSSTIAWSSSKPPLLTIPTTRSARERSPAAAVTESPGRAPSRAASARPSTASSVAPPVGQRPSRPQCGKSGATPARRSSVWPGLGTRRSNHTPASSARSLRPRAESATGAVSEGASPTTLCRQKMVRMRWRCASSRKLWGGRTPPGAAATAGSTTTLAPKLRSSAASRSPTSSETVPSAA